jgi:hypothetical protein
MKGSCLGALTASFGQATLCGLLLMLPLAVIGGLIGGRMRKTR